MGRQYFDDGSWIETDSTGTTFAANTEGTVVSKVEADGDYFRSPGYWTDARESSKLNAYTPITQETAGQAWWERLAVYGATRAIDSHFGPTTQDKTQAGATFAGQNGRTYSQVGRNANGQPMQPGEGGSLVPLLLGAAALFMLA